MTAKNMEILFEIDNNKTPYHTKPYVIPVAQISLMKRAISEMVKNRALSEYNGNSRLVEPNFEVSKKTTEFE